MKNNFIWMLAFLAFSCNPVQEKSDAFGNFEATEVRISSMVAGKLLYLNVNEGDNVKAGQLLGQIDTVNLFLKKEQLKASYQAAWAKRPGIKTQVTVFEEQKRSATKELERFRRLAREGAAAQKTADDLADRIAILEKQIKNVEAQYGLLDSELKVIETQIAQIDQQVAESGIFAPFTGTVMTKLAEGHELVGVGTPLFVVANLDTMFLKAFISGSQLNDLNLGQKVEILIDRDKKTYKHLSGTVSWIASTAEFTPKTIQTKNERTDQVYAVKIKTTNPEGTLKIGMPGEVIFKEPEKSQHHEKLSSKN